MIEARGLSKSFRVHRKTPGLKGSITALFRRKWIENQALTNVTLSIGAGEIVGLVGANGAGKTTLVKCLSGIIHPSSGEARVLGFIPWERPLEFRRQVALIMGQKAQLWWDLPAADCFLLLKEIYRISDRDYHETLNHLVDMLGVANQMNIQVRRLSLGERMKMELIAALLHRPRIVFLDEPTIGLDLTAQRAIRKFILDYRTKYRPAMVITSHYMEDIEQLCQRIVIIGKGRIVYDGLLADVLKKYANHKIIKIQLQEPILEFDKDSLWQTGEVLDVDQATGFVQLKLHREKISSFVSLVLGRFQVSDLNIQEADIGDVIERIMREGISS